MERGTDDLVPEGPGLTGRLDVMQQIDAVQASGADYAKIAGELAAMRDSNLTLVGDRLGAMTQALQNMTLRLQNITVEPT